MTVAISGAQGRRLDGIKVPHPNSVAPADVLDNIKAVVDQTHVADGLNMPELHMRHGELHIRRLLQVQSTVIPPGWLVPNYLAAQATSLA